MSLQYWGRLRIVYNKFGLIRKLILLDMLEVSPGVGYIVHRGKLHLWRRGCSGGGSGPSDLKTAPHRRRAAAAHRHRRSHRERAGRGISHLRRRQRADADGRALTCQIPGPRTLGVARLQVYQARSSSRPNPSWRAEMIPTLTALRPHVGEPVTRSTAQIPDCASSWTIAMSATCCSRPTCWGARLGFARNAARMTPCRSSSMRHGGGVGGRDGRRELLFSDSA